MYDKLAAWLRLSAERIHEQADALTALDRAIGDGDHGINMDRGFMAIVAMLDATEPPLAANLNDAEASGTLLKSAGRTLISTVGGASGPLYGTAFLRAAAAIAASDGKAADTIVAAGASATRIPAPPRRPFFCARSPTSLRAEAPAPRVRSRIRLHEMGREVTCTAMGSLTRHIVGLQHVSLPIPGNPDSLETARRFYGEILGLDEYPRPTTLPGVGIWYRLGGLELHLYREPSGVAANSQSIRHPCFEVDDVDRLRAHLVSAGVPTRDHDGEIPGRPRFFAVDPFGNTLEFVHLEANHW
jgi:catechol 2,3-dioxygenase-like lactoylglutathione lyase family enzyme